MQPTVSLELDGAVASIVFSAAPDNYASPTLLRLVADALDRIDADPAIRCSLLRSEGRSFCAGVDLAGDEAVIGGSGMDAVASLYQQAERIYRRKKPMIAVVQGAAIGAGLGLAVSADFRIAGPRARFCANFVRLGFFPGFALTYTLPRLVGVQRASLMMLTARRVKPEDGLVWGLVDEVVPEEDLLAAARRFAAEIAENAPLSLVEVKKTLSDELWRNVSAAMAREHAQQSALRGTADYAEGVASVFARRDANFQGR